MTSPRRPWSQSPRLSSSSSGRATTTAEESSGFTIGKKRFTLLSFAQLIGVLIVVLLIARLTWVHAALGPELTEKAELQRSRLFPEPARRGSIFDRDGHTLAYTMMARSLTISPKVLRREETERQERLLEQEPEYDKLSAEERAARVSENVEKRFDHIAQEIPRIIKDGGGDFPGLKSSEIREKFNQDTYYEVLVRNVDPDVADRIRDEFPGIAADHQDIRHYPNGAVAQNVVGKTSMEGFGQFGLEMYANDLLAGQDGSYAQDVSTQGQLIPGTRREEVKSRDGVNVELTLDLNLQTYVQQQIQQAKEQSGAKSAQAVVLDAVTGEVLAMANSDTIDPTGNIAAQQERGRTFNNPAVAAPFEPGSVAKVITAAATIDNGLTSPDEVLAVPGSIDMAGVTVNDAWPHGTLGLTTTGVFAKSSNVGTLMLAQRLGEDRFDEYLRAFGLGSTTGIELPDETAGLLPARQNWGGGTFANLPIGQGMAISLLQMASIYQTIANDGERIEPRIIKRKTDAEGNELPLTQPKVVQVIKPETARTVRTMFQGVVQGARGGQSGTAPDAAIEGYQIAGKTGTAQQINPETGAYSNSDYWITFAGIAPADNPRFVVALMLDDPERGVHGGRGGTAAPLFKDIASWLLARDNVPLSPELEGKLVLQAY